MRWSRGLLRTVQLSLAMGMCLFIGKSKVLAQSAALPQAANSGSSTPVFDVSTIKRSKLGDDGSQGIGWHPDTFTTTYASTKMLLENAFGIRPDLISGLPGWAESAHFDIVAKVVEADAPTLEKLTREQRRKMVQQLLADRFQLKTHIEVKQLPVFDMSIAKGGIKFHEVSHADPSDKQGMVTFSNTEITGYGVPVGNLVMVLERHVERNVIDKTGLTGKYDFHLKWRPEEAGSDAGLDDDAAPAFFTALEEQLGLKLQSSKGPVDTLVVDNIAAPSEN